MDLRDGQHVEFFWQDWDNKIMAVREFSCKGRFVAAESAVYGRRDEVKLTNIPSTLTGFRLERLVDQGSEVTD